MNQSKVFESLHAILVETARSRRTISEGDLMARLGWNDHGRTRRLFLAFLLQSIGTIQQRIGTVPLLPAVVVSGVTGRPAAAFFEQAREYRRLAAAEDEEAFWLRELAEVYAFWGSVGR